MRNPTFQLITGSVLVLLNVVAVLAGLCVIGHCLPRIAEGRMTASLPIFGDITGANAELVGLFVGFAIVIVGLTYTYKAYSECPSKDRRSFWDLLRRHCPNGSGIES